MAAAARGVAACAGASGPRRPPAPTRPLARGLAVVAGLALAWRLCSPSSCYTAPPHGVRGRRAALEQGVLSVSAALLAAEAGLPAPAFADGKEIPPGYVPSEFVAKAVGQKVTTPNGLVYEPLDLGTSETGPRAGPPRSGTTLYVRYTGHIDGFDGPVFDSSALRGKRRADKQDYVEIRLNLEPYITNGMFEALKLMKVGAKGRFVQPPKLSYNDGKIAIDSDDESDLKGAKVPAGTTMYYDVELVQIIKP